jgi:hypothetical protein
MKALAIIRLGTEDLRYQHETFLNAGEAGGDWLPTPITRAITTGIGRVTFVPISGGVAEIGSGNAGGMGRIESAYAKVFGFGSRPIVSMRTTPFFLAFRAWTPTPGTFINATVINLGVFNGFGGTVNVGIGIFGFSSLVQWGILRLDAFFGFVSFDAGTKTTADTVTPVDIYLWSDGIQMYASVDAEPEFSPAWVNAAIPAQPAGLRALAHRSLLPNGDDIVNIAEYLLVVPSI